MLDRIASTVVVKLSPLPLPVHVIDKVVEGPWTRLGATFAALAALFALFTLVLVAVQIRLARTEIDLVNQDLQNNKKMIDEALRQPDLRPMPRPQIKNVPLLLGEPPDSLGILLNASVANVGDHIAKYVMIEWLVPVEALRTGVEHHVRSLSGRTFAFWERYFPIDSVFWPNGLSTALDLYVGLRVDVQDCEMLLRFYDDARTYPRRGYYRFRYNRQMPQGHVSLRPDGMLEVSADGIAEGTA